MVNFNSKNGYFNFSLLFCPLVEVLVTEQEKGQKKASETWPLNSQVQQGLMSKSALFLFGLQRWIAKLDQVFGGRYYKRGFKDF